MQLFRRLLVQNLVEERALPTESAVGSKGVQTMQQGARQFDCSVRLRSSNSQYQNLDNALYLVSVQSLPHSLRAHLSQVGSYSKFTLFHLSCISVPPDGLVVTNLSMCLFVSRWGCMYQKKGCKVCWLRTCP